MFTEAIQTLSRTDQNKNRIYVHKSALTSYWKSLSFLPSKQDVLTSNSAALSGSNFTPDSEQAGYLCVCICVCHAQVAYRSNAKQPVYSDSSLLDRTDIQHAKDVSKLASQVTHIQLTQYAVKRQRQKVKATDKGWVNFKIKVETQGKQKWENTVTRTFSK